MDLEVFWEYPAGLLEVNLEVVELCILEGILVNPSESLCRFASSMDAPEVRRVGFAQALCPLLPLPGQSSTSPLGGEGALVREGGFAQC